MMSSGCMVVVASVEVQMLSVLTMFKGLPGDGVGARKVGFQVHLETTN